MGFSEKDFERFKQNELRPEDTFHFECEMCGKCCRNRDDPILITGADIYRIAKALGKATMDIVASHTKMYIGGTSHLPVLVLKERMDGSCSFLRNGRCTVQQNKPAVCALFPLGRYYSSQDKRFHYFVNPVSCQPGRKDGRSWTLQEWLDEFKIEDGEDQARAWDRLIVGLATVTSQMKRDKINGRILDLMILSMYVGYDIEKPYIEQVEQHMETLADVFEQEFHKKLKFEQL